MNYFGSGLLRSLTILVLVGCSVTDAFAQLTVASGLNATALAQLLAEIDRLPAGTLRNNSDR